MKISKERVVEQGYEAGLKQSPFRLPPRVLMKHFVLSSVDSKVCFNSMPLMARSVLKHSIQMQHVRTDQRECKNGMEKRFPLGTEGLLILGCTFQRTYARPEKGILLALPKSVLRKSLSTFEGS
ncbi:hypothetical protein M569_00074 [Genlisea aurea]|uniref:Uncharacterized protein n=1 Tax=Genlisea aurea TaxID=192259 RepID=S8D4K2_9LAMI|nr:hypothetical protein M569_00074 [Genlisea aurea]